jgi:hypothetical protein
MKWYSGSSARPFLSFYQALKLDHFGIEEYQEQKHDRKRSLFFLAGMRFPS